MHIRIDMLNNKTIIRLCFVSVRILVAVALRSLGDFNQNTDFYKIMILY